MWGTRPGATERIRKRRTGVIFFASWPGIFGACWHHSPQPRPLKNVDFWHSMASGTCHTLLYGVQPRST